MSLDLGKPFSLNFNDVSDDRFNAKMWTIDTADNLFNGVKIPGQFLLPTSTGNGFTKNTPCFRDVDDAENIIALGLKKHTHANDTDIEGGLHSDVLINNIGNLLPFFGQSYYDTDFHKQTSGTGAAVTGVTAGNSGYVFIESGTSTDGYANIRRFGQVIDFTKKSAMIVCIRLEGTLTSYITRFGVNGEMINDANEATLKSYGIEACSGQSNWQTWSSDGTTRSTVATTYAVDTSLHTWMAQHYPSTPNIIFTRDNDTTNAVTKSTNIPTTGLSESDQLFIAGVKSTTSSASKTLKYVGAAVYGNIGTSTWKWYLT